MTFRKIAKTDELAVGDDPCHFFYYSTFHKSGGAIERSTHSNTRRAIDEVGARPPRANDRRSALERTAASNILPALAYLPEYTVEILALLNSGTWYIVGYHQK